MSAIVFGYVILFTLLLALGAAAIEWGLQGRVAVRYSWTVAIVLAVLAPPVALIWHTTTGQTDGHEVVDTASRLGASSTAGASEATPSGAKRVAALDINAGMLRSDAPVISNAPTVRATARAALSQFDARVGRLAFVVWAVLSLALVTWIAIGTLRWRRARARWTRTTIDGVDVDISSMTGPAVLGLMSQRIVLPEWVPAMRPEYRRLILAHESEHISARDPQRLALAIAAIVVMPWNIALWWCAARLRRAIELDCDTRVLCRFPATKDYGYVLLEVAQRARMTGPLAVPMVSLLGLPSELELRLRAMTRPRSAGARMIVAGGILACVAVGAAFSAPVPGLDVAIAADTIPAGTSISRAAQSREIDSVNALLRSFQKRVVKLEEARAELQTTRLALQNAEKNFVLPDSSRAAIAGTHPTTYFSVRMPSPTPTIPEASRSKWNSDITMIKAQADRAVRTRYPDVILHPNRAAVIWFVADSTGRVLRSTYRGGITRDPLVSQSVSVHFPDLNRAAIESIGGLDDVLQRRNLYIVWVRLTGDPAKFFESNITTPR
jgi:beta-lactamase regulating signal transducer with metallopeptidase domain